MERRGGGGFSIRIIWRGVGEVGVGREKSVFSIFSPLSYRNRVIRFYMHPSHTSLFQSHLWQREQQQRVFSHISQIRKQEMIPAPLQEMTQSELSH